MTGRICAVIAEAIRRSPLSDYTERFSALYASTRGELFIRELPFLTQLNVRANPRDSPLMGHLADTLGCPLPLEPNTVALGRDDRRTLWLGPDEWLVVAPESQAIALEKSLRTGLDGTFGSIVDVSASRIVLEIRGSGARDVLAHGIPIDLDQRRFPPATCAQTLLAKSQVIIERRDDGEAFRLFVRSSLARYVADWLLDAAQWREVSDGEPVFG
jgi:sarcosine oxidase, subunit gamma